MAAVAGVESAPTADIPWGVKAIIVAGGAAVALAVGGMSVVLPRIETALAHGPQDKFLIKMLVGVVGAGIVIGSPLAGYLCDRFGPRWVLAFLYLLFAVGAAGMVLNSLDALVAVRLLVGISGGGAGTASIIIVNRLQPEKRLKWMGVYVASSFIGAIALFPLAGLLAELDWHDIFGIYLSGLPLAALALIALRNGSTRKAATASEAVEKRPGLLSWFPFRFALLSVIIGWVIYLLLIYTPFVLRDMGFGPAKSSIVMLANAVTGTLTALLFGWARRYLSSNGAFVFAFATSAVGGLIIASASGYAAVMIGAAIAGLGSGWFMTNLFGVVGAQLKAQEQGRAVGLIKAFNYLSMPMSVAAVERLSQVYSPRVPIFIAAAIAVVMLAVGIYQMKRPRPGRWRRSIQ